MIDVDTIVADSAPGYPRAKTVGVVETPSGYRCVAGRALLATWRHEHARVVPAFILPVTEEQACIIEAADHSRRPLPSVMRALRALALAKVAASSSAPLFGLTTADALRCRTLIDRYPALLEQSASPWIGVGHVRLLVTLKPEFGIRFVQKALASKLTTRSLATLIQGGSLDTNASSVHLEQAERNLHSRLSAPVAIRQQASGYRVSIDWTNVDVLTGVLLRLGRAPTAGHHYKPQIKRTLTFALQDLDEFQALFGHLLPEE
jgi:hypothetical protein